jgi:type II secretory pathway predicted ATPase ExeA
LDITPASRKVDMFRQIQDRIITLDREKRVTPLIVLDECQYLNTAILNDLKIIFNFGMDSANHAVLILAGLPLLNNILLKQVHEPIAQRITINYMFAGLSEAEANSYVLQGLRACGASDKVFQPAALASLYAASGGSIRKLNALINNALIAGAQKRLDFIDTEVIMDSLNEISIA